MTLMNPTKYRELLNTFIVAGFKFCKFENFIPQINGQLIIRHDVDFCVEMAFQMATIEAEHHITSTYHFLVSSDSYNVLSQNNIAIIRSIKDMGHSIGLHYDPTSHEDECLGFQSELRLFEEYFGVVNSMSFHRPSTRLFGDIEWLPERIIGAYQKQFFNDIAYVSDSQGAFRYGHPHDNPAFNSFGNMQLLIHPIWWMTTEASAVEKIKGFLSSNSDSMSHHIAKNCIPWRDLND